MERLQVDLLTVVGHKVTALLGLLHPIEVLRPAYRGSGNKSRRPLESFDDRRRSRRTLARRVRCLGHLLTVQHREHADDRRTGQNSRCDGRRRDQRSSTASP
jgi:hypothetical protein